MRTFIHFASPQSQERHNLVWLIAAFFTVAAIVLVAATAAAHGAPIIDGLYTGDWCAPTMVTVFGPDSLTYLTSPVCALGTEIFWDDWDAANYGGAPPGVADTIGFLVGGAPFAPLTDWEVDIDFFATTADAATVFFTVSLGWFPSTVGIPPHVQIAIDIDGPLSGNSFWYDPAPAGTLPVGLASIPGGMAADYLVTTDTAGFVAFVWEATSVPGAWTLAGPVPLAWSGALAPGPSVIELGVPWPLFAPGPMFAPGAPASMTIMAAHGAPAPNSPPGAADAPMTPSEDVFSESGAGFTLSPDLCPPGPPSTDCEIYFGPGGGGGSADAYISVLYPAADLAITKTNGASAVIPGTAVTYTITASNPTGPFYAPGVMVSDTFPASLTGCTWTCVGSVGGVCTAAGAGNISDSATLPIGGAVTYTATCILSNAATGSLVNTATIAAPIGIIDPNPANDSATDTDTILTLDFGDAPDPTYPTLLAGNGARHAIVGPFLGASVDSEPDGQPTPGADGDDLDGNDDEGGVVFTSAIIAGQLSTVNITTNGGGGILDGWIDFNADGDWNDPGEKVFPGIPLAVGVNALSFTPPAAAPAGTTFARFRFSQIGGLSPTGLAIDGEVEDEQLTVARQADLAIAVADSRDPATAGLSLRYTLTTSNIGPSDAGGITVTDTLSTSTTFLSVVPGSPTCTHSSGTVTCNLGTLSASSSTDVVVTVLVNTGTTGTITNSATVSATEPDPVSGNNSDSEATNVVTPIFADGFETGDMTAWDNHVPEHVLVVGGLDDQLDEIWASFRLDTAILQRLQPSPVTLIAGIGNSGLAVFRLEIRGNPEHPAIRAQALLDHDSWADTGWRTVGPLTGWLNMSWRRALVDLNDGSFEIRHDGSLVLELPGLDNDRSTVSALAWTELDGRSALEVLNHR